MIAPGRLLLAVAAQLVAGGAGADERRFDVVSFERVRVEAAVRVRVTTAASPRAIATGDTDVVKRIVVEPRGTTLIVRVASGAASPGLVPQTGEMPVVTLSTTRLAGAIVVAPAAVSIDSVKGERVDLSVTNGGTLQVEGVDASELSAVLAGEGSMTLAGRARRARLVSNGPGMLDASALASDELRVAFDGDGLATASARYAADVAARGTGRVDVTGSALCTVRAAASAQVRCGRR